VKKNLKLFYKYLNSKQFNRDNIGPLKVNDVIIDDDKLIAENLNAYFSSVFTIEDLKDMPNIEHLKPEIMILESVTFTPENIKQKVKKLKPFSAPGPDGFNSSLLIELSEEPCYPLCLLFTKFMNEGSVPKEWKCANVTPIFKKGSKLNPVDQVL